MCARGKWCVSEDNVNIDTFTSDIIDGRALLMVHGSLGLVSELEAFVAKKSSDVLGQMLGEEKKLPQDDQQVTTPIASN